MDVWSLDSRGVLENNKENASTNPSKIMFSVFFSPSRVSQGHSLQKIQGVLDCFEPSNTNTELAVRGEPTSDWTLPHGNAPN